MPNTNEREAVIASLIRILREERARKGLSASEVAVRSGLNHATILRIEAGARIPTIDTLLRITDALGQSLPKLIARAIKNASQASSKDSAA